MAKDFFEQMNSRVINNNLQDIRNHVLELVNPTFIVPRHTLIDIIKREIVPFKAKIMLNKRLVLFYADITTQDNAYLGHELPFQNLARKRPKKVINS